MATYELFCKLIHELIHNLKINIPEIRRTTHKFYL